MATAKSKAITAMIKDLMLKIIFIPLLGVLLPLLSGIIRYSNHSFTSLLLYNLYCIFISILIWQGCNWIHFKLRLFYSSIPGILLKTFTICSISAVYTACISSLSLMVWYAISTEIFTWASSLRFITFCTIAAILITLIYEILYLSKEREIDSQLVDLLDKERVHAELQALSKEMDPHFLFNSLTALNYLIKKNPEQAYIFNNRLATVYKYFLVNKNKELILLKEELDFVDSYFYLLRIRHENKLELHKSLPEENESLLLPPFALQILVENAIKHNDFTEQQPLVIHIKKEEKFLEVSNNLMAKTSAANSTGIGLSNLNARYKILFQKKIIIKTTRENYIVRLPLNI